MFTGLDEISFKSICWELTVRDLSVLSQTKALVSVHFDGNHNCMDRKTREVVSKGNLPSKLHLCHTTVYDLREAPQTHGYPLALCHGNLTKLVVQLRESHEMAGVTKQHRIPPLRKIQYLEIAHSGLEASGHRKTILKAVTNKSTGLAFESLQYVSLALPAPSFAESDYEDESDEVLAVDCGPVLQRFKS